MQEITSFDSNRSQLDGIFLTVFFKTCIFISLFSYLESCGPSFLFLRFLFFPQSVPRTPSLHTLIFLYYVLSRNTTPLSGHRTKTKTDVLTWVLFYHIFICVCNVITGKGSNYSIYNMFVTHPPGGRCQCIMKYGGEHTLIEGLVIIDRNKQKPEFPVPWGTLISSRQVEVRGNPFWPTSHVLLRNMIETLKDTQSLVKFHLPFCIKYK